MSYSSECVHRCHSAPDLNIPSLYFVIISQQDSLADLVAQKRASKEVVQTDAIAEKDSIIIGEIEGTPFEKRRNLAFFLYGGLYQGEIDCCWYSDVNINVQHFSSLHALKPVSM